MISLRSFANVSSISPFTLTIRKNLSQNLILLSRYHSSGPNFTSTSDSVLTSLSPLSNDRVEITSFNDKKVLSKSSKAFKEFMFDKTITKICHGHKVVNANYIGNYFDLNLGHKVIHYQNSCEICDDVQLDFLLDTYKVQHSKWPLLKLYQTMCEFIEKDFEQFYTKFTDHLLMSLNDPELFKRKQLEMKDIFDRTIMISNLTSGISKIDIYERIAKFPCPEKKVMQSTKGNFAHIISARRSTSIEMLEHLRKERHSNSSLGARYQAKLFRNLIEKGTAQKSSPSEGKCVKFINLISSNDTHAALLDFSYNHSSTMCKVTLEDGQSMIFDLNTSEIESFAKLTENVSIVKIIPRLDAESCWANFQRLHLFDYKITNIFDINGAFDIKQKTLFKSDNQNMKQIMEFYKSSNLFDLSKNLFKSLSDQELEMLIDLQEMYVIGAISSEYLAYNKAKNSFKDKYKSILKVW